MSTESPNFWRPLHAIRFDDLDDLRANGTPESMRLDFKNWKFLQGSEEVRKHLCAEQEVVGRIRHPKRRPRSSDPRALRRGSQPASNEALMPPISPRAVAQVRRRGQPGGGTACVSIDSATFVPSSGGGGTRITATRSSVSSKIRSRRSTTRRRSASFITSPSSASTCSSPAAQRVPTAPAPCGHLSRPPRPCPSLPRLGLRAPRHPPRRLDLPLEDAPRRLQEVPRLKAHRHVFGCPALRRR